MSGQMYVEYQIPSQVTHRYPIVMPVVLLLPSVELASIDPAMNP